VILWVKVVIERPMIFAGKVEGLGEYLGLDVQE
jgi:phage shock protein PspC (stress-responsive transcriptional regulator)